VDRTIAKLVNVICFGKLSFNMPPFANVFIVPGCMYFQSIYVTLSQTNQVKYNENAGN